MSEPTGKRDAQKSVERIHAFRDELGQLAREGVLELTVEQQSRLDRHLDKTLADLAQRFDVDINVSQKQISLGMRIVSTLGGLAFCAAVFLFFYRYWGLITTQSQVVILIVTPIVVLIAMYFTARRERTPYYTALLGIVAFASFIMNLVVLGSIFNITPSQNAYLAWGIFALILAYSCRFRLLLAAGLVCLLICSAATLTALSGPYWTFCASRPEFFLLPGLAAVLTPLVAHHRESSDFPFVYRLVGLVAVFAALEVLMHQGRLSVLPIGKKTIEGVYQVAAFAASGAAIWLGIRSQILGIVNLGSAFFALYLFDRLVTWWWDWMPKYLFFLIIGLIAVGLLTVFRGIRSRTLQVQQP